MKMHEHVTCKLKNIMGSTKSKPTSTHHCNKVNAHLKCMKHCYNANAMQCMMIYTHLSKTHPKKFHKNFINIEKSQKISKTPKVRSECMKCMIKG